MVLKEDIKDAIYNAVKRDLDWFFDYECTRVDVADYDFRFDGVKRYEVETDLMVGDRYFMINAVFCDAELNSDLDFTLYDVDVDVTECDDNDNETKTELSFRAI